MGLCAFLATLHFMLLLTVFTAVAYVQNKPGTLSVIFYLLIFVFIWTTSLHMHLLFMVARHVLHVYIYVIQFMLSCTVG